MMQRICASARRDGSRPEGAFLLRPPASQPRDTGAGSAAKLRLTPPIEHRREASLRCFDLFHRPAGRGLEISGAPGAEACLIRHDGRPWRFL